MDRAIKIRSSRSILANNRSAPGGRTATSSACSNQENSSSKREQHRRFRHNMATNRYVAVRERADQKIVTGLIGKTACRKRGKNHWVLARSRSRGYVKRNLTET